MGVVNQVPRDRTLRVVGRDAEVRVGVVAGRGVLGEPDEEDQVGVDEIALVEVWNGDAVFEGALGTVGGGWGEFEGGFYGDFG